jgi:serine-type D-Ala-D-Ala carboxypeptidase/endopeptidase (penicillin-binding protein 4)
MSEVKAGFAYFKESIIGAIAGAAVVALVVFTAGSPSPSSSNTALPSESPSSSVTASATPTATDTACSVAKLAADKRLGSLQAIVVDNATGKTLYDQGGETGSATASAMKLLTAAAALKVLTPTYRVTTSVYVDPADASHIYFVGGGDPTLSRTPNGQQSVYQNAPKLSDLAVMINSWARTNSVPAITQITLDSSLFNGPTYEASWPKTELTEGYVSNVTALQVDGDRSAPAQQTSRRSPSPVMRAGNYLKSAIGKSAKSAVLVEGVAPTGLTPIASVTSQPISVWINHMLQVSDNTEAEYLARLVSLKLGGDGSFASINETMQTALKSLGLDTTGMVLVDGSGESNKNKVSPKFFTDLMKLVIAGSNNLNIIAQGLPVAGESGSLASRFTGKNVDAAGKVFAKTGWILHGYTLAGYIKPADGSTLTFAVYALGPNVGDSAKQAIDNLVTGFYRCGLKLSQN